MTDHDLSQGDFFAPPDPILTCGTIADLHDLARGCTRCEELVEARTQVVPGVGPPDARVFFIGEAPGRREDAQGEPFVGDAGAYLTELLEKIGLSRGEVFISNIVKCRPPENRNPKTPEIENCAPYLERQLALIKPELVVLLGRFALERFFPREKITESAGVPRRKTIAGHEMTFLPLLHPAFGIRRQDLKPEIEKSFWKIREMLDGAGGPAE
ncbi:MAG: uracil-DNA glycosylase [Gemmatimonadetes bacterium]|uniref:Type-4 uracil-DNA glycosylase n=1 Tax=Candidatus Kutchimonas denitrificans TaxID=3056748 RepID=A0AAE5C9F7_9BACT|nr:uracil-DNA glycosylase [Gemmatimonadota bacterium]NIR75436.1 uracil-DNA glycosylase [Candidatus Kutchimonas denitrificans]NIS01750.1 uracil-DNA glycosylase [Gemmatimonadota bacterium]NIT67532.1 uracil-DNA glycosylase [Gemmatimonadota bacterium]NIU53395.1 uracil-DNA glycosylase [Gemmatimonadota bacterium]